MDHGSPVRDAGRRRRRLARALAVAIGAAALAVPLYAGTASGGAIAVDASLGACKPGGGGILCRIDASFSGVGGADYYTATVRGPDGAAQEFGEVPAGSASVWARYSRDGTYTITINAWDQGRRVERGSSSAGG
jgi:hypothetical protein